MPAISIVIPVFNEEKALPQLIAYLQRCDQIAASEIIVVDGQSTDQTLAVAQQLGVTVLRAKKGRASQLNAGAKIATGEVLYFLHADSFPPQHFITAIQQAINSREEAGCFRLRFDSSHSFLRILAWFTRFSYTFLRFGDQSLFVTKKQFEAVGGYDESLVIMEDQDIVRRLVATTDFRVLPFYITTSSRKYMENGYVRLQLLFFLFYFLAKAGIANTFITRLYRSWVKNGKI